MAHTVELEERDGAWWARYDGVIVARAVSLRAATAAVALVLTIDHRERAG